MNPDAVDWIIRTLSPASPPEAAGTRQLERASSALHGASIALIEAGITDGDNHKLIAAKTRIDNEIDLRNGTLRRPRGGRIAVDLPHTGS